MRLIQLDDKERVFGLDLFRAVAVILIVIGHGAFLAGDIFSFVPSIPIIDGVDLFFVLSGFLIGSMVIRSIEKTGRFNFKDVLVFLKRRWFRTIPNYYLILVLNLVLMYLGVTYDDTSWFSWKFFFFLQNFATGFMGFFWESWSLAIEEWFYIFLPLLLFLALKFLRPKRAILVSIVLLLVFPLLYRLSMIDDPVDTFWFDVNFRKVVLTRLDAIGYGVLMAYVKFYYPGFFTKSRNWLLLAGILLVYINSKIPKEPTDFYAKTFNFCYIPLCASLFLAKADSIKTIKSGRFTRFITYISVISYSMYLVNHGIVANTFASHLLPHNRLENVLYYSIYWFFVLAISTVIYRFYEKPITDLRDKF